MTKPLQGNGLIRELAGNPITYIQGTGTICVIDCEAPSVSAIARVSASPTSTTTIDFNVTFTASVTGVDTTDFGSDVLESTGVTIDSVIGSGTNYTITMIHAGGNGTIGLNLVDDNSIVDGVGSAVWSISSAER